MSGGMNLGKREFYEKVGLQDEKLFMYSDEVDIGTRAKKLGFKMMIPRLFISETTPLKIFLHSKFKKITQACHML